MRTTDPGGLILLLALVVGCASGPRAPAQPSATPAAPETEATGANSTDGGTASPGTLERTGAALDAAMRDLRLRVETNASTVTDQLRAELAKLEKRYDAAKLQLDALGDQAGDEGDKARKNAAIAAENLRKEIDRLRDRLRK